MNTLILQAQSTTGAVPAGAALAGAALEIFLMLLVAAIIGFLTAYFYYRWKHKSSTSSELIKLHNRSKQLERDNELLQKDYRALQKKYEASQALQKEAANEIDNAKLHKTNLEHQLEEKDEVLQRIANKKHLLNYESFGRASQDEIDDLKKISGIGPFIQSKLHALDIYTFRQIANFSKDDIQNVNQAIEFFPGRIHRDEWVPQAKELVHSNGEKTALFERLKRRKHKIDYSSIGIAHPSEAHDLTQIKGIGPFIQEKLYALDIYTFEQISCFTPADIKTVTEIIEFFPGRIERDRWVEQAKVLASSVNTQKPSADLR